MKNPFTGYFFFVLFGLVCMGHLVGHGAQKVAKEEQKVSTISIQSDFLEADADKRVIEFYGTVTAKMNDFELHSERLWVYPKAKAQKTEKDWGIEKVVAQGKVVIKRVTGEVIEAERAIYFVEKDQIEITGNPVLTRGPDSIRGEKIEVFLKENRIKVSSKGSEKVTAIVRSVSRTGEKGD
ncbi:MAG: LptA/OstA family protein [Desulfatiglandales bacterium]